MKRFKLSHRSSNRIFKKTFSTTKKLNNVLSNRGGIRL